MSAPFTPEQEARIREIAREEAEAAVHRFGAKVTAAPSSGRKLGR